MDLFGPIGSQALQRLATPATKNPRMILHKRVFTEGLLDIGDEKSLPKNEASGKKVCHFCALWRQVGLHGQ